jgi:hypothetical protein
MARDPLWIVLVVTLLVIAVIVVRSRSTSGGKENFGPRDYYAFKGVGGQTDVDVPPYSVEFLPTDPRVEYLQGYPDYGYADASGHVWATSPDLSTSLGIGSGEGTFGFGRYAASFMA